MTALPVKSAIRWIASELVHRVPVQLHKRIAVQSFAVGDAEADAELCWRIASNPLLRIEQYTLYDDRRPVDESALLRDDDLTIEARVEHLSKHGGPRDFLMKEIGVPIRRVHSGTRAAVLAQSTSPLISLFHNPASMLRDDFAAILQHTATHAGSPVTFIVGNNLFPLFASLREYAARRMPADLVFHVHDEPFVLAKGTFSTAFANQVFDGLLATPGASQPAFARFVDAAKRHLADTGELHMRDDIVVAIENRPAMQQALSAAAADNAHQNA